MWRAHFLFVGLLVRRAASDRGRFGEFFSADALLPLYLRNKVAFTLEEQAARRMR